MGKNSQIEGQLNIFEVFDVSSEQYVCQSNILINSIQKLSLMSTKFIRGVIKQISQQDDIFHAYFVTLDELSELTGVSKNNMYRDIPKMVNNITSNPIMVKEDDGESVRGVNIPWGTIIYDTNKGIAFKLNTDLGKYLLGLVNYYSQYKFDYIRSMTSVYSIRIYELLLSKIDKRYFPKKGATIKCTLTEIKEICNCTEKSYELYANVNRRVVKIAVDEINKYTDLKVTANGYKEKGVYAGFEFKIVIKSNKYLQKSSEESEKYIEDNKDKIEFIIEHTGFEIEEAAEICKIILTKQYSDETFKEIVTYVNNREKEGKISADKKGNVRKYKYMKGVMNDWKSPKSTKTNMFNQYQQSANEIDYDKLQNDFIEMTNK